MDEIMRVETNEAELNSDEFVFAFICENCREAPTCPRCVLARQALDAIERMQNALCAGQLCVHPCDHCQGAYLGQDPPQARPLREQLNRLQAFKSGIESLMDEYDALPRLKVCALLDAFEQANATHDRHGLNMGL